MLDTRFALVVHSNGLDEISTAAVTKILQLKDGSIKESQVNPKDLGIEPADIDNLIVADAAASAKIIKDILAGKETGVGKDIVVLNASAAIIAGGLAEDFASAMKLAETSISDGNASACLEKLIEVSNKQ
jgi:anthranilate phosphoribosyltransferase